MSTEQTRIEQRVVAMVLTCVIGLSFVGFVRGIRWNPTPKRSGLFHSPESTVAMSAQSPSVVPATSYADMRRTETGPTAHAKPELPPAEDAFEFQRCITCHDPQMLQFSPSQEAKSASLRKRAERRAYNGAPPVVPHAVEGTNGAACIACHQSGRRIGELAANRMPHDTFTACLQCHAPPPPKALRSLATSGRENLFVGLPAPTAGPRAYPGAPPLIPHTTWMRDQCLSCHGGPGGWPGLEVTHRWRTNCLQCHGVSAALEQAIVEDAVTRQEPAQRVAARPDENQDGARAKGKPAFNAARP